MKNFLIVGLGGLIGSMLRYQFGLWLASKSISIPLGTLFVNIAGSFIVGMLAASFSKQPMFYLFLITGFCGGFTTFSAFSLENMKLIQSGQFWAALLYIFISFSTTVLSCFGGYYIMLKSGNP